jgi:hypothetical protein
MTDFRITKKFGSGSSASDGYDIYLNRQDNIDNLTAADVNSLANSIVETQKALIDGYAIEKLQPAAFSMSADNEVMVYDTATSKMIKKVMATSSEVSAKLTSPLTTKGDLIVYNGSTHVRLGAGTDGYALVADSTQASGLKYVAISSGGGNSVTGDAYITSGNWLFDSTKGVESTSASSTLNIGTLANTTTLNIGTNATAINIGTGTPGTAIIIGNAGDTVTIQGTLVSSSANNVSSEAQLTAALAAITGSSVDTTITVVASFNITSNKTIPANVTLRGLGWGTILTMTASTRIILSSGAELKDIRIKESSHTTGTANPLVAVNASVSFAFLTRVFFDIASSRNIYCVSIFSTAVSTRILYSKFSNMTGNTAIDNSGIDTIASYGYIETT